MQNLSSKSSLFCQNCANIILIIQTLIQQMIQLNSLKLPQQAGEFYSLQFQRLQFTFIDILDMKILRDFAHSKQTQFGKITIRIPLDWLLSYSHFFKQTSYILLTQYQEIVLLPYLLRQLPHVRVLATSLMYELARIYAASFQQKIKDTDVTLQNLTYDQQLDIEAVFQQKFNVNLRESRSIYSVQQLEQTLNKITKINYYQIYDTERGVYLVAHPSGKNNGSCLWEVQSIQTKQKLLFVNDISQHSWRTCQPYNLQRLSMSNKQKNFDYVVLSNKALERLQNDGQDLRVAEIIKRMSQNMVDSTNTVVVLKDQSVITDLISRIPMQPEGKCSAIFLSQNSFHDMINFCNSFVDYLSDHFRNQIFGEQPEYPLIHYCIYKQKGLIHSGGLQEIAIRKKLPLREIVLQNSPFIMFIKDYEAYLEAEDLAHIPKKVIIELEIQNNFSRAMLNEFVAVFSQAKIYGFNDKVTLPRIQNVKMNKKLILSDNFQKPIFIKAVNITSDLFQRFRLKNNQLILERQSIDLLTLPTNFMEQLSNQLVRKDVIIIQKDKQSIRTEKTHISLSPTFSLKVKSSHIQELLITQRFLNSISSKYNLP